MQEDWNKIVNQTQKTGLREGISDGRDSNFQKSFDVGFKEGFQNAFVLGRCKGTLRALSLEHGSQLDEVLLDKSARGNCVVCKNGDLLNNTIDDIIAKQVKESTEHCEQLHSKHEVLRQIL